MSRTIIVRGRAGSRKGTPGRRVELTLNKLEAFYDFRQEDAASLLGISLTSLKSACRQLGLKRWPYTRFKLEGVARTHSSIQPSTLKQAVELTGTCEGHSKTDERTHDDSSTLWSSSLEVAQSSKALHAHNLPIQPMGETSDPASSSNGMLVPLTASATPEELRILGEWDEEHRELLVNNEWLDWFLSSDDSTDMSSLP
ncbi:hypothetical protein GUITHDRAFT_107821 [Guillardia theta CCMP2712]|uniref:RWP-RK domain-containing protein n=1 Tax=Guillardia theta (strain CCMP2712) TaxID=905079 RepID=L1JCD0_GUITC|nr:hypothetical protein GUITHDRAFT_107821 [Guillardia theta CCMP2712]EKX46203.1 hypothetical protein GUITHDRAFT_107821 [Guillardia theta CCMP2712]|eukprot:XP_005833183.1 hypothetical protein GUITHDRAFT_107821 [Guillardia theta CCMP2712]